MTQVPARMRPAKDCQMLSQNIALLAAHGNLKTDIALDYCESGDDNRKLWAWIERHHGSG